MVVRRDVFVDMFGRMRKIFGTGANTIVYELGLATGENDARELMEAFGEGVLVGSLAQLVFLYSAQGWGRPELVDLTLDPVKTTLRIRDNFECAGVLSNAPNSNFIRGHIAGLGKTIFDKTIVCQETKCLAKGDPYCEFVAAEEWAFA